MRRNGELLLAIEKCTEAIKSFPENNFFHKVLGDIYFQNGNLEEGCNEYIENLKYITNKPELFKTFAKFYRTFEKKASANQIETFKHKIKQSIYENCFSEEITDSLISFLGNEVIVDQKLIDFLVLSDDDKNYETVMQNINKWENERNLICIQSLISHKLNSSDYTRSKKINTDLIVYLEKTGRFESALDLIESSQRPYDFTMQSRILRICRRLTDYNHAERLLIIDDSYIDRSDFNVQYELVYYFQFKNDNESLQKTLKKMSQGASRSIPIAKTLYNFYLSFNRFDDAQTLYEHIQRLEANKKNKNYRNRREEQSESEQIVWQRLKDLVSDQEHNRQMIALRDLLKGFSHELGQPITNIRYGVQLQKLKMQKGIDTREDVDILLDSVLEQTSRIGSLLSRFRPIVSSKSELTYFSVKRCIDQVFEDLMIRLESHNIDYSVKGKEEIKLYGDAVQFSQVFYNLILNALQAIDSNGNIHVVIVCKQNNVKIYFSDNGPGIPKENHKKIFEPFFSTKDPTSGNGGEGLGLFIVWNILKMFNGTIYIDEKYINGAKFIITLPLPKEDNLTNEQSINN